MTPERPEWHRRAICHGMGHMFFIEPKRGPNAGARVSPDVATAKTICALCPVTNDCLMSAYNRGEVYGVWGGVWFENGAERKKARRLIKLRLAWIAAEAEAQVSSRDGKQDIPSESRSAPTDDAGDGAATRWSELPADRRDTQDLSWRRAQRSAKSA